MYTIRPFVTFALPKKITENQRRITYAWREKPLLEQMRGRLTELLAQAKESPPLFLSLRTEVENATPLEKIEVGISLVEALMKESAFTYRDASFDHHTYANQLSAATKTSVRCESSRRAAEKKLEPQWDDKLTIEDSRKMGAACLRFDTRPMPTWTTRLQETSEDPAQFYIGYVRSALQQLFALLIPHDWRHEAKEAYIETLQELPTTCDAHYFPPEQHNVQHRVMLDYAANATKAQQANMMCYADSVRAQTDNLQKASGLCMVDVCVDWREEH